MKTCFKCGVQKPLSEFYRHPEMSDGHLGKCKECNKKDVQENYRKRFEQYRKYDAERFQQPDRKAAVIANATKHRKIHHQRVYARSKAAYALSTGKMIRKPCEVCGNPKSQAHHDDYTKPLDVVFLCFRHHRERHGQLLHLKEK